MIYNAYEMQRSWLAGASALAHSSAEFLSNPANPFAAENRRVQVTNLQSKLEAAKQ